jgi:trimeric autotransporter adhesin
MNRIYRLCWNRASKQWVAASELASSAAPANLSRKRTVGHHMMMLSVMAASLCAAGLSHAGNGPAGGQIVGGSGQIQQVGNTTTIVQNSPTLSLNWQSFNIGQNQTVDFQQPGSNAIAINRIFSSTPSEIYGHLNANGQVWLINPNGILFGQSAQVNVGGLVASTLDVDDNSLSSDSRTFSGSGKGSVINQGSITAAKGGYVALLANQVSNQGVVTAQLGTVALGGGSAITLTFSGEKLLHVQVDQSTLNNLAENRQLIVADGGQVIMTAGAKDALLASAVNNTGIVQAQTVQNQNGTITLLGGMTAGTVNVGGTLDASAPNGGSGGSIETSAAHFSLASGMNITASAPQGKAGTWLVDPVNLTIDGPSATTISNTLNGGTNVTEQTTSTGATGVGVQSSGAGDIDVEAGISWGNAAATLTLSAYNAINVDAQINGSGKVFLQSGVGQTGATAANINISSAGSIVGGAGVTLASGNNFINSAGSAAVSTGTAAPWLIYSTNPTLDTTGGLTPNFIQYNAPYQTTPAASGNGFLYSLAPTITLTGLTSTISKPYDGTNAATLASSNFTTSGLVNGDLISGGSATGTYASVNAGSNISVSATAAHTSFTFTDASGTIPVYGYQLTGTATGTIGTIDPLQLTASIIGNPTKIYDGTTTATLTSSNYQVTGFISGQGVTVGQPQSVSYAGSSAGTEAVNATFDAENFTANSGTNLANYILPTAATGNGTISQAPLFIRGLLASSKEYDGTTSATLSGTTSLYGVIGNDQVQLDSTNGVGNFATANAGNGITVTASGFSLTGAQATDYTLMPVNGLSANITARPLSISGISAVGRAYDGATDATLSGTGQLNGVLAIDTSNVSLSSNSATGNFSQSNVGNNLDVTASGFKLTGSAAGNYSLSQPTGLTADITPAELTISLNTTPTKVYDGTSAANLSSSEFSINGFVAGQGATVTQNSSSYNSANVADANTVTVNLQPSDFTANSGTSMSNYTFAPTFTATGNITPVVLTASIVGNPTKTYDGTNTATLTSSNYALSGFVGSDSITVNQPNGTYADSNAGVWTVTASVVAGDYSAVGSTLLSNYVVPSTISGWGTITPAQVTGTIVGAISGLTKVYDGTTVAIIPSADITFSGFKNGDNASLNVSSVTGAYATKNVGVQPVSASIPSGDFTFTSGNASDYTFPVMAYGTGEITPAQLQVTLNALTKVYDGTNNASVNSGSFSISGFVNGESATINPTTAFTYGGSNVGSYTVSGTLTSGNYTPASGTLLSNYTLVTSVTGPGTITPASLYIVNVYANSKVYDTTDNDTLNVGKAALAGLVSSDVGDVTLTSATTGTFSQSNVGNGLAVTPGTFSIGGSQAGNYTLIQPSGLTANITPAPVTVSGIVANNRDYDGTTIATFNSSSYTLGGIYAVDQPNITLSSTSAVGTFASPNVGSNIPVTAAGFGLTGSGSGNYTLIQPTGLSANISPATLVATITGDPTKNYDGSTSATLLASDYTLTINGGQVVTDITIPQSATASYANANAGTEQVTSTLVSSDFAASNGDNLSNYILPTGATGNGTILPKVLNLTGTRVYDGTTTANGSLFGTLTGLNGDKLVVQGSGVTEFKDPGSYTNTNGSGTLNISGLTLAAASGNSAVASNYTLVGTALVNSNDTFTITPYILNLSGTRVYDQTTNVNGGLFGTLIGLNGDTLTVSGTATTSKKDVGSYTKAAGTLNISNLQLVANGGANASDYTLVKGTDTFTITPLLLTLDATGINKTYNGNTTAGVTLSVDPNGNQVFNGDVINFAAGTATFATANAGNGIAIAVSGITATGKDAADYSFATTASTAADIFQLPLNLTGTRVYNGGTDADGSLFGSVNGINGDSFTISGSGLLGGKDVGTYTNSNPNPLSFGLNNLQLVSVSGNINNYTLQGGTDTFTVTPIILNISGTRVYDHTTNADGSLFGTLQGLGSETLTLSGAGTTSAKDVGTYTNGGAPNNLDVSGLTLVGVGATDAADYTLKGGTDSFTITPLSITLDASALSKTYDTTTTATASLSVDSGGNQVYAGDTINFAYGSANFASPNAANGIGVTVSNITASGADAADYSFNTTAMTTANITPVIINLSGTRVYDGGTDADPSIFGSNGVVNGISGQTLQLSSTNTNALQSKDAGNESFASGAINNYSLSGLNGSLGSNYTLIGGTDTVDVTPLQISVTAVANNKVYDGTTTASLSSLTSSGVLAGDNVTFTDTGANFVSPNAANGIQVDVNGISATGTDAGNYSFVNTTTTQANITPRPIVLTSQRVYDGTTNADASLFTTNGTIATGVGSEALTLTGTGVLVTKNAGSERAFQNLGSLVLGDNNGALASNYTLSPISSDWVTITPLAITVSASGSNKVYDGNTTATVSLSSNGILPGDQVSFADGSANFSTSNVGNGVSIAVAGIGASGADAGNYSFNTTATTSGNITPYVLNLTGTRTYNGTTGADASLFGNDGVLTGIDGQTLTLSGSGTLVTKNVGSELPFTSGGLGGFSLSGNGSALASNYTLTGGTDWVTITPAILTVVGTTTSNKVYDGNTTDTLSGSTLSGLFGNDNVTLDNDGTGQFDTKNVGIGKSVSTDMSISGADAGNYILEQPTGLVANITPLPITITATGTNRLYNGQVGDKVSLSTTGILSGDQVSFTYGSATFNNPYVGNNKPVTVTGITATGADGGNYLILDPTTTTEANITNLGFVGSGVQSSWIAQLQYGMGPRPIATPYGSADMDAVGVFTGNQKLRHRPIERNRIRTDFHSGMPLQSEDGGVRLPTDASP